MVGVALGVGASAQGLKAVGWALGESVVAMVKVAAVVKGWEERGELGVPLGERSIVFIKSTDQIPSAATVAETASAPLCL